MMSRCFPLATAVPRLWTGKETFPSAFMVSTGVGGRGGGIEAIGIHVPGALGHSFELFQLLMDRLGGN